MEKLRRCNNCDRTEEERLFLFLRDPRTKQRIGFCSIACYIQGMKDRGVYEHIKAEAIKEHNKIYKK